MENKDTMQAFPSDYMPGTAVTPGMELRDYFAAHAPNPPDWFYPKEWVEDKIVPAPDLGAGYVRKRLVSCREEPMEHSTRWRYAYADAMMRQRTK